MKRSQEDVGKPDEPAKEIEWDISDSDLKRSEKPALSCLEPWMGDEEGPEGTGMGWRGARNA